MQFTQREFLWLDDLLHLEEHSCKKLHFYAQYCSDPQIAQLVEKAAHMHARHFGMLVEQLSRANTAQGTPGEYQAVRSGYPSQGYRQPGVYQPQSGGYQSQFQSHRSPYTGSQSFSGFSQFGRPQNPAQTATTSMSTGSSPLQSRS